MGDVISFDDRYQDTRLREAARAEHIRRAAAQNRMLPPAQAALIADRLHRLLNEVKGEPARDDHRPLTKQRIAAQAWAGRKDPPSALSYLRHYARPRGTTPRAGKGPARHPAGYLALADALCELTGRAPERVLIRLFRDTDLDLAGDVWSRTSDAQELSAFVEFVREEVRELGAHQRLAEYFRWLAQHGPALIRTGVPASWATHLDEGDPTGDLEASLVPVLSALPKDGVGVPPVFAGLFPNVPLYRLEDRPRLPVTLRVWQPGVSAAGLAKMLDGPLRADALFARLRHAASDSLLVSAEVVPYRELRLAILPADLSGAADAAFELRNVLLLELADPLPDGAGACSQLVPWLPLAAWLPELVDARGSGTVALAFDAPCDPFARAGFAVEVLDRASRLPVLDAMPWEAWTPFEGVAEPGEVTFEPFDIARVRRYLIEWPYAHAERTQWLLPEHPEAASAMPHGSGAALLNAGFIADGPNAVPALLEHDAELLWDQVNRIRQERLSRARALRLEAQRRRRARRAARRDRPRTGPET